MNSGDFPPSAIDSLSSVTKVRKLNFHVIRGVWEMAKEGKAI